MRKLLLLLLLIPNLVIGEFDVQGALDEGYTLEEINNYSAGKFDVERARADGLSEEEIQAAIAAGPPKKEPEEIDCRNFTKKEQKEFKKQCDGYYKVKRLQCAVSSSNAKTDFAAKKIYEACLDRMGVPKK